MPPHVGIDSHLDYICSRAQATQRALPPDGLEAWAQVVECGYEGYLAKDEASAYEDGPTRRWLKVKQKDWTVEEDGCGGGSARRRLQVNHHWRLTRRAA